jgi:hypothetical protein
MLPVSPEQLRPFPEPEMLSDSGGMSLFGLIWLPVLATVIALLMLWAWQHRRNNPTQAAILTLLRLRSGLEREITATESGTDNTFAKLPPELTTSSALDELVHTVRQWRACVLQEQPPSSSDFTQNETANDSLSSSGCSSFWAAKNCKRPTHRCWFACNERRAMAQPPQATGGIARRIGTLAILRPTDARPARAAVFRRHCGPADGVPVPWQTREMTSAIANILSAAGNKPDKLAGKE